MLPLVTGDLRRQSCARPSWSTTVRGVIWLKVHTSSVLQRSGWVAEQVGDVDSDWQLDPPAIKKKKKAYVKAYLDALYQEMGTLFSIELKTDWLHNYMPLLLRKVAPGFRIIAQSKETLLAAQNTVYTVMSVALDTVAVSQSACKMLRDIVVTEETVHSAHQRLLAFTPQHRYLRDDPQAHAADVLRVRRQHVWISEREATVLSTAVDGADAQDDATAAGRRQAGQRGCRWR